MDIIRIRNNVSKVIPRLRELLFETLEDKESEKLIQSLIRLQMQQGVKGDGSQIKPDYSEAYAKIKRRKVPNLKVTGGFYESIFTEVFDKFETIAISASKKVGSWNLGEIHEHHYGSGIFELTNENLKILKLNVIPRWLKKIQNEINR